MKWILLQEGGRIHFRDQWKNNSTKLPMCGRSLTSGASDSRFPFLSNPIHINLFQEWGCTKSWNRLKLAKLPIRINQFIRIQAEHVNVLFNLSSCLLVPSRGYGPVHPKRKHTLNAPTHTLARPKVRFDSMGRRKLSWKFAKISILNRRVCRNCFSPYMPRIIFLSYNFITPPPPPPCKPPAFPLLFCFPVDNDVETGGSI